MVIPKEYFQIPKAYLWNHNAVGFSWSCYCMPQQGIPYRTRISVRDDEGNPTSLLNASVRSEEVSYVPGRGLQAAQDMYQAYDEIAWHGHGQRNSLEHTIKMGPGSPQNFFAQNRLPSRMAEKSLG